MNVVLYGRYSSDKQSETSIEQQFKACREYCQRNGYTIIAEYSDEAMSGRTDARPQFQRMIADSKRKLFQGLVVYSVDRFSRKLYQAATYENELAKNGVSIISASEPIFSGSSGSIEKFILYLQMVNAQQYSDALAEKVKRGMSYHAEQGYYVGGNISLGYKAEIAEGTGKKKLVVDEEMAPVVKRIFEMYADENMIMADICRYLNGLGIKTALGGEFNRSSLGTVLKNRKYIGIIVIQNKYRLTKHL